jgi:alanine racemase
MSVDPLRPAAHDDPALDHRPVARVSVGALRGNLAAARRSGITGVDPAVLHADGWGHGEVVVANAVADSGLPWGGPDTPTVLTGDALFGLTTGSAVMTLVGTVISTKTLRTGEGVSYGYTFRAASDTRIALVTGGYGQGVVRSLGNAVAVRVAARDAPIIGRVAMDVCVVDIGAIADPVEPGDGVVFFGDRAAGHPVLSSWAGATGLTAAELVAAAGLHARREVVG